MKRTVLCNRRVLLMWNNSCKISHDNHTHPLVVLHPSTRLGSNINNHQHQQHQQRRYQHTKQQGYQSIGSFHSDNLGVLMSLSNSDYQAPTLPFAPDEFQSIYQNHQEGHRRTLVSSSISSSSISLSEHFLLDLDQWTFLNHGAFGAALRVGCQRAEQWRYYLERQPLRYFDRDLLPHLAHANRCLANFSSSSSSSSSDSIQVRQGMTLIQNATVGLNTVLRGFAREYGTSSSNSSSCTHVILWDTSYGSVKKLALHIFGKNQVTEIPLQKKYLHRFKHVRDPTTVFLEALDDTMKELRIRDGSKQILLILDHTTSNTAINMPINVIATHAKDTYGKDTVQVLVDGAHGLLAQELNLDDFYSSNDNDNALPKAPIDYYISNGHKWLSCPRGVAMLFCPHEHLRDTVLSEPAIISHGVDENDLFSRFVWDGTRDYAAALALPVVLDFWKDRGIDSVRTTMKNNLMQGIQSLVDQWHEQDCQQHDWLQQDITLVPPSLLSPMALVRLPRKLCGSLDDPKTSNDAKLVQDFLFDRRIEVPIKCINGQLYVRVSCHMYNTLDNFNRLGEVLTTMQ